MPVGFVIQGEPLKGCLRWRRIAVRLKLSAAFFHGLPIVVPDLAMPMRPEMAHFKLASQGRP